MSSRSFHSLFMVASCATAALGCYLVSLRVASERAALENVETQIVFAQRDMRVLQTEIGTRGRLSQLERWNAGAFALSAPAANQFLKGGFELARLAQPERKPEFQAPVVLASAPARVARPAMGEAGTDDSGAPTVVAAAAPPTNSLLHQASFKTETREVPAQPVARLPLATVHSTDKPATAARSVSSKSVAKSGLAAAQPAAKKSVDKPVAIKARPVTKPVRVAKADPLAPLTARHSGQSKDSTADR